MWNMLLAALRISAVTWVLCGFLYPLLVTGMARVVFPDQANGSLVMRADGGVAGSRLVGQLWEGPQWFHGRPSATTDTDPKDPSKTIPAPYNAANSSSSNYGPTSQALNDRLLGDRKALEANAPETTGRLLPSDMLTASGSGLDPDITPANAKLQAVSVAKARGMSVAQLDAMIAQHTTGRDLWMFGEPRVNVMALNYALERAQAGRRTSAARIDVLLTYSD
ncbi:MAG: potassium-transporting ATPase subunit KdpC [Pelomonas sp.]|nr:potassium-transporting ATPase subunit KdpC [Roseateles sp.]MBV8469043.1 potassium-transporting ATPase subunit KdpC [Burkholderiaceae bacterium]MBV8605075.1 potassium-transporting ATPase subunit KdpC [Roseateles sp.]